MAAGGQQDCVVEWRKSHALSPKNTKDEFPFYFGSVARWNSVKNMCSVIATHSWDAAWIVAARTYFLGLSRTTMHVVHDYSFRGDRLINLWLRGDAQGVVDAMRTYDTFPFETVARELLETNADNEDLVRTFSSTRHCPGITATASCLTRGWLCFSWTPAARPT